MKNTFYTLLCADFRDTLTRVVTGLQYKHVDRGIPASESIPANLLQHLCRIL